MAQINLIWAGLNADVRSAAASLPATTGVIDNLLSESHGGILSRFQGTAVTVCIKFLMGKRVRAYGVLLMLVVFIRLKISSRGGVHAPCGSEWGGILFRWHNSVRV